MADAIKFILNGDACTVTDAPTTMTLLQYLRTRQHLTGTKEGCAEGDCGACTVAVGRLENGQVVYKSINACIAFLPTLDGRQVVTVEHLRKKTGDLHPVQRAMADCHAAQCGFCTPGFVMALATLIDNKKNANDEDIQDAIAGNLCRCTGYRPIVEAARTANKATDRRLESDADALQKLARTTCFAYENGKQKFFAPVTSAELANLLHQYPNATLLAGGTDVGLWVTKMHQTLDVIIYTGNVADLRTVNKTPDAIDIGGSVTYTEAFSALAAIDPSMEDLLKRLGSQHIRNAGTIGGNIANGSPIGDGMPPLIALGAEIILRSASGTRRLPLENYFIAYRQQDRKPGEFLERVIVPFKKPDTFFKVYKISKRFDQDISAVCAAFAIELKNGAVASARICFGGMAGTPKRAAATEKFLTGKAWTQDVADQAAALMARDYQPMTDMRASADYRLQAAQNLLQRFYVETTSPDVKTQVYRYAE